MVWPTDCFYDECVLKAGHPLWPIAHRSEPVLAEVPFLGPTQLSQLVGAPHVGVAVVGERHRMVSTTRDGHNLVSEEDLCGRLPAVVGLVAQLCERVVTPGEDLAIAGECHRMIGTATDFNHCFVGQLFDFGGHFSRLVRVNTQLSVSVLTPGIALARSGQSYSVLEAADDVHQLFAT